MKNAASSLTRKECFFFHFEHEFVQRKRTYQSLREKPGHDWQLMVTSNLSTKLDHFQISWWHQLGLSGNSEGWREQCPIIGAWTTYPYICLQIGKEIVCPWPGISSHMTRWDQPDWGHSWAAHSRGTGSTPGSRLRARGRKFSGSRFPDHDQPRLGISSEPRPPTAAATAGSSFPGSMKTIEELV